MVIDLNPAEEVGGLEMLSIQALRAVAALSVVFCHFSYLSNILSGRPNDPIPLYSLASGVDLFFVISGFIMVYSSTRLFGADGASKFFIARRLIRILPMYWVTTLVATGLRASPPEDVLKSLFFIPYGSGFPVLASGWTLNFEMFFYLVFAAALFLRRQMAVAAVCVALVGLNILSWISPPSSFEIVFWSDPIVLEFCFGMMIALLYLEGGVRLHPIARILLVIFGATAIWFFSPSGAIPTGYRFAFWGIPVATIFAGTVLGNDITLGRFTGPIKLLGDASYSIYLVHGLVSISIVLTWDVLQSFGLYRVLVAGVLVSIGISFITFFLVERPILNAFVNMKRAAAAG